MALTDKLTAIADAIRGKTGGTDKLSLDGMVTAIETIETGGSGDSQLDALLNRSITEVSSNASGVPDYVFQKCTALTTANFPLATSIGQNAFNNCTALTTANFPLATSIGQSAFYNNMCLPEVNLPLITALAQREFQQCFKLATIDLPSVTSIGTYVFYDCRILTALILRSETLCTLGNISSLNNCHHIRGTVAAVENPDGLQDGYIYVPAALVDEYKAATNWTTVATQFRALEDYTVDGTITGALDPNKI